MDTGIDFAAEIEHAANGEPIEAATIGQDSWRWEGDERALPISAVGRPLPWEEAKGWLTYAYDDGFGGADCHPVWVWTASRVIFVDEYDGSTSVTWVPRHPTDGQPGMPGGG